MGEELTGNRWDAWLGVNQDLGYYQDTIATDYNEDYWQCRKDAEAGNERAKQYLTAFAAELLKG